jgi:hypothetical protein
MKINVTNFDKIEQALAIANGRATVRLAHRQNAEAYVVIIEKALTEKGIPKNLWKGLKFRVMPGAEKLPNAYFNKGAPSATSFTLERMASGWFMVAASRKEFYKSQMLTLLTAFTEEQKEAIISKAYKF